MTANPIQPETPPSGRSSPPQNRPITSRTTPTARQPIEARLLDLMATGAEEIHSPSSSRDARWITSLSRGGPYCETDMVSA